MTTIVVGFQRRVLNNFLDFRQEQKEKLEADPSLTIGDVISLNVTILKVPTWSLAGDSRVTTRHPFAGWCTIERGSGGDDRQ